MHCRHCKHTDTASCSDGTKSTFLFHSDAPHCPLHISLWLFSWIESNVHDIRHSYFNINYQLIEELREVCFPFQSTSHVTPLHPTSNRRISICLFLFLGDVFYLEW